MPSMQEQLTEYKTNKHSKFLSTDNGIAWERKQGDPEGDIDDCPNFSETDMEKLNNMYEEFELDDGHDDDDMSISTNEDEIWSGIERVYKEPLPPQAVWKHGTTLIIGDSMIGGIEERRLRNTKVRSHPGASVEDLHFHITPYLRKKPTNIIIHVGTNNARSDNSDTIIEKLIQLKEYILSKCPNTKIVFSSLIVRLDDENAAKVVAETNSKLLHLGADIVGNDNIQSNHISQRGLHLNGKGTTRLALNLINVLKGFSD